MLKNIGDVYIPKQFRDPTLDNWSLKHFTGPELSQLNRIFTHLRRGGVAVLSGKWQQIVEAMDYVDRKKNELIRPSVKTKHVRGARVSKGRSNVKGDTLAISRLMCYANEVGVLQVDPCPYVPYLLELVGENPGANHGCPFLLPVTTVQKLTEALGKMYPVPALGESLVAFENVLPPRSKETIQCFQKGIQSMKQHLPFGADVLDIGCGSGCLTLLAAQELADLGVTIYASDLLPEAVATTRFNIEHFSDRHLSEAFPIQLMAPGDLFDTVLPLHGFDLIIFNAPWVVARARNRAEIAIHDEHQKVVSRFFDTVCEHLNVDGRILLGYADASGPNAIYNLEAIMKTAGFATRKIIKQRVATHRSKRKWEHIMIYELAMTRKCHRVVVD